MQLYHIALNNLRRRKAKMVFVLVGLLIGVATIVSVYSMVEAMKTEMTRQASAFGANVVITPDAGELTLSYGGITLPEIMFDVERLTMEDAAAIENLENREMLYAAAPKLLGVGTLVNGQNTIIVGAVPVQEFLVKPWLRLQGEQEEMEEETYKPPRMVSEEGMEYEKLDLSREDLESLQLGDNDILVGAVLAESLGINKGDSLEISGVEFNVSSLLVESGSGEDEQIIMNITAAQALLNRPGEVSLIELSVDYTLGSEEALLAELYEAIPTAQITSLRQETLRRDELLGQLVRFGGSVSALILFVGMLVAGLTMSGAVRERTREIGVLRAIGFRKAHVTKIILMEGAVISVIGGFLGYFAGIMAARFAGPVISGMSITVPWRLDLFAIAVVIAIAIGLLASIVPARQASQLDPVEALRFI